MDVDDALKLVGGYRRWHLSMFTLLGLTVFIPLCWQGLAIVFIGRPLSLQEGHFL